jgi:hypothetical protein
LGGRDSLLSSLLFVGGPALDGLAVGGGLPQPRADARRKTLAKPIVRLERLAAKKGSGTFCAQRDINSPVVSLSLLEDLG